MKRYALAALLIAALFIGATAATADEGMWTFDNPPTKQLQEKYHFTPTQEWLDHVRLSSVRLNDGGSGSFVSPHGLLLTNHHVARHQLQNNSTAEHDYLRDGFYAATPAAEMKSPDLEVNVLVSMENVTAQVNAAARPNMSDKQSFDARKSVIAQIERDSTTKTGLRSDVVTLYQGGEYWLYRYKKYTDVRLVFAPEQQTAFFGGDPDNFTYPRYDLDMAIFRVYEGGKPLETTNYLKWNPKGASDSELVFVSGHPGSTQRLDTEAQLKFERDYAEPAVLKMLADRIATMQSYSARGAEQARQAGSMIFGLQNSQKAYIGRYEGLQDSKLMAKKQGEENDFRSKVNANPEWKREYGSAWDQIAQAEQKGASRFNQAFYHRSGSQLAGTAATLVEYVAEIKKPDGERLPGFHDAQLESLRYRLLSPAPVYLEMEKASMTGSLAFDAKSLAPTDPWLTAILNGKSPDAAAHAWLDGTKLADVAVRKQLLEGGQAAVDASTDPLIVLARKLDPMVREQIKWQEDNIDSVVTHAGEQLGKARFLVYGKSTYPTPRSLCGCLTALFRAIR